MRLIDADVLIDEIKKDTQKVIKQDDKVGSFWLGYAAGLVIKQPTIQPEKAQLSQEGTTSDLINRQAAIDALQKEINKGKPPFDDVMGSIRCGVRLARNIIEDLPSAQPERTCVNCGRTVNNGGWYADGGTRCPIEEHYALPKDGFCHLWEKRNVTDDDYPERQEK